MYKQVIFLTDKIEEFKSSWNVVCKPTPYDNGYIISLGWENELQSRGIEFTYVEYIAPIIEDEII